MKPLHIITSLLVAAVISLQVFESRAASLPVSGVEGFHRGDSDSPGNGSIARVIDGSGMTKGDADDPSTWTVSSTAWANDWQGFSANNTGNNTWVVFDLGSPAAALETMYLWNVQENGALNRGAREFNVYYATAPDLAPPTTSGTVTPYDFSSGGWTVAGAGELQMGTQVGDVGQVFDVSAASGARYIGLHLTANHGGTRTGLAEIAFSDVENADAISLGEEVEPPDPADDPSIPITAVFGFHQGDSLDADGSILRVADDSIVKNDIKDPSTWTHSNVWQDDWQGFAVPGTMENGTWAVLDLGEAQNLETLLLWNVNEPNAIDRGMNEFRLHYATSPSVAPPSAGGVQTPYDFSSGGWTAFGETRTLERGSAMGGQPVNGTFDLTGMPPARYIGIEILSNHGSGIRVGFAHAVVLPNPNPTPVPQLRITQNGGNLSIEWDSQAGMVYNLRSDADLQPEPALWPIHGTNGNIEATPPLNTLTIPLPAANELFFVIEGFPKPPAVVFEDNFDDRNDLAPWTNSSPDGNPWELGVPTAVLGPPTAFSPLNAVGTVLAGNYIASSAVDTYVVSSLRSPAMDLSGIVSGTISYRRFVDMEDPVFDVATVNLLDATDDSLIEELETDIGNGSLDWEAVSYDIPAAAIGKTVYFQIVFSSDNFDSMQTGLVIDDFKVEGVEP